MNPLLAFRTLCVRKETTFENGCRKFRIVFEAIYDSDFCNRFQLGVDEATYGLYEVGTYYDLQPRISGDQELK